MEFIYEKIGFKSEVKTNRKKNVGGDHMVQIFGNKTVSFLTFYHYLDVWKQT